VEGDIVIAVDLSLDLVGPSIDLVASGFHLRQGYGGQVSRKDSENLRLRSTAAAFRLKAEATQTNAGAAAA
jgi:hypothetical protein